MKRLIILFCCLFFNGYLLADVPHILANGNVVDANQLNENFQYLDGFKYTVRANGTVIGKAKPYVSSGISITTLLLKISNDFEVVTLLRDGTLSNMGVYYESNDCSGTPYRYIAAAGQFLYGHLKIVLFDVNGQLYYAPKPTTLYNSLSIQSGMSDGSCSAQSTSTGAYYEELLPNNSAVTGVTTYPFPTPITVDGLTEATVQ